MSNAAFQTPASNRLAAQPSTATPIILRSSSASDTISLTAYGTISGSPGTSTKALTGKVEVKTSDSFTAITQAILASSAAGLVTGLATGTSAIGDIRGDVNPVDGHTLTIGLAGNTVAYRFKTTLAAINDVQIGATLADTMVSLNHAINGDGVAGTDYYTGTVAHPQLSGSLSSDVITLTDRIACKRQLAWSMTQSNSDFSIREPIGGSDGVTLFSFPIGITYAANPLVFSTEDLSTVTLPAGMTDLVTSAIMVGGGFCTVRVNSDNATSISVSVDVSTDSANWKNIDAFSVDNASERKLVYSENIEYVRIRISNPSTVDTKFDARVIW